MVGTLILPPPFSPTSTAYPLHIAPVIIILRTSLSLMSYLTF